MRRGGLPVSRSPRQRLELDVHGFRLRNLVCGCSLLVVGRGFVVRVRRARRLLADVALIGVKPTVLVRGTFGGWQACSPGSSVGGSGATGSAMVMATGSETLRFPARSVATART